MKIAFYVILYVLLLLFANVSNASVLSDFNTGLDGWTAVTSYGTPLPYLLDDLTDGNPGGCAELVGCPELGDSYWMVAPTAFLGNWSKYDGLGTLKWDRIASGGYLQGAPDYVKRSTVIISGPGGTAIYTAAGLVSDFWQTFSSPIDSSYWNVYSGSWNSIMQNVTSFKILIAVGQKQKFYPQYIIFGETGIGSIAYGPVNGMDNISLILEELSPIPEPSVLMMFCAGVVCLMFYSFQRQKKVVYQNNI